MRWKLPVGLLFVVMSSTAKAQVPPPPPPEGQHAIGMQIKKSIENHELDRLATVLADDLVFYRDGEVAANGKQAYLDLEGPKISNPDLYISLIDGYYSAGTISFTQFFNSRATFDNIPANCCWGYEYVRFDIKNGKIQRIFNLKGGHSPLDPQGLPAS